jgi:hypothetical protein
MYFFLLLVLSLVKRDNYIYYAYIYILILKLDTILNVPNIFLVDSLEIKRYYQE